MIDITYTNVEDTCFILELQGHANFNPGNDIVCSAASILAYTLAGSIENIDPMLIDSEIIMGSGKVKVKTTLKDMASSVINRIINAIYETILIGYLQLQAKYSDNVKVTVNKK